MVSDSERKSRRKLLLFLLLPFFVLLWPPFYDTLDPKLFGIPFFYWFQLAWIIITAFITAALYFLGA